MDHLGVLGDFGGDLLEGEVAGAGVVDDGAVDEVHAQKEALYMELVGELKAVPEVLEHVLEGHGRIPMAVVSGSTRESVVRSLETLGILEKFDVLVCAGDYKRGKPDPEPFLMAAEKLGVSPGDCLVFEDTEMGIAAATAAGMASVKILQPWERAEAAAAAGK